MGVVALVAARVVGYRVVVRPDLEVTVTKVADDVRIGDPSRRLPPLNDDLVDWDEDFEVRIVDRPRRPCPGVGGLNERGDRNGETERQADCADATSLHVHHGNPPETPSHSGRPSFRSYPT